MTKAVFPGSFDPLTFGHLDVIQRSSLLFDQVVVAVGVNTTKTAMFTTEEKVALIRENVKDLQNVNVMVMRGLTCNFVTAVTGDVIIRGIRNVQDYEYERDIADINNCLGKVDTVLIPSKTAYQDISSSNLKEVAKFGADVSSFVPRNVSKLLKMKLESN
ncbi:pantetheine-phosphate adenylyltransferase [Oenococcus sp. UCMA 16435]|nr:pantetheine-phosphate adenylyltransferase [Oenococcus sp. UCMA 16435]